MYKSPDIVCMKLQSWHWEYNLLYFQHMLHKFELWIIMVYQSICEYRWTKLKCVNVFIYWCIMCDCCFEFSVASCWINPNLTTPVQICEWDSSSPTITWIAPNLPVSAVWIVDIDWDGFNLVLVCSTWGNEACWKNSFHWFPFCDHKLCCICC